MVYLDTCLDEKTGMVVLHIGEIYEPAILLLDIHPKDSVILLKGHLFIHFYCYSIHSSHPKCPSTDEWILKM